METKRRAVRSAKRTKNGMTKSRTKYPGNVDDEDVSRKDN